MPRGGKRVGTPGANYGNRSDLQAGPRTLPVTAAPGQGYGDAGAQRASQQAVPMANAPLTQTPDVMGSAQQFTPPPVPPIGAPSMNPAEPVTAGMPSGAGAGLPPPAPAPLLSGVALLTALGDAASPETKALRDVLTAAQNNQAAP